MKKNIKHPALVGLNIGLLASIAVSFITFLLLPKVFDAFEARSLDIRYKSRLSYLWKERNATTIDDIIIVDIDNRSLEKLGQFNQWPRSYHAQLIDYLTDGGALAIGFDILFLEPERDPAEDRALIASTGNNANVYHSLAFSSAEPDAFLYRMENPPTGFNADKFTAVSNKKFIKNLITLERFDGKLVDLYNASAGVGFANFSPDNDSVIRAMPLFLDFAGREYLSFSLAVAVGALGANPANIEITHGGKIIIHPPGAVGNAVKIPVDDKYRMLVNYQGSFQTFRYISYYDVIMQRVPKELFNGRIVLVGTSAAGLSDIRPVPFQDAFPGVEIHANIIYNILSQQFIKKQNIIFVLLNIIFWAVVVSVFGIFFKPWKNALFIILVSGGLIYISLMLFSRYAYWLELVRPLLAVIFSYMFVYVYRFIHEERDKQRLKNMFQHYLTASVVDEMMKNPELLKLGGEKRYATALFSDVENFTTLSENMPPEEMVAQLNEYLTAMTRIVFQYEGYLDKYEGDAIMAIFGIPVEHPGHAQRACMAALEMQKKLVQLRNQWKKQNKPEFYARIGINSGHMIAGNIGGTERFDYTVIGDPVNLASRLEGANKIYQTRILLSEFTKNHLPDGFVTRELDQIRVVGKTEPVCVFELVSNSHNDVSADTRRLIDEFSRGLELYRNKKWEQALKKFQTVLQINDRDHPAKMFIERCDYFKKNPVPPDWDGVFDIITK